MPDVYTKITDAAPALLERLMTGLEVRAAEPQQRAMLDTYLTDVTLPQSAHVLEVGCGTGGDTWQLFPALWGLFYLHQVRGQLQRARDVGEELLDLA